MLKTGLSRRILAREIFGGAAHKKKRLWIFQTLGPTGHGGESSERA
jgi:hypothetical protein